ncbi:MAG: AAA family ATPase [Halobacteriota archaeon]
MASPLWPDRHAPTLDELPQAHLERYLTAAAQRPINLLLHGPRGVGKTAAVRAMARAAHDDPERDLLVLNVADFFDRTKAEIAEDPRFEPFLENTRRLSKREMIHRVFRESTAHAPVSGRYRTVLLDNAESVREDYQQSLRRLIERHHRTTQFVLTTRQLGRIIPALQSRCLPVPVPPPDAAAVVDRLATILEREGVPYEESALVLLADDAGGNLRRAILAAQATHVQATREGDGSVTEAAVVETVRGLGQGEAFAAVLAAAERGDFDGARDALDDLLVEVGLDGREVLDGLLEAGRTSRDERGAGELTRLAAEVDFHLATGGDDRLQLSHLLAEVAASRGG